MTDPIRKRAENIANEIWIRYFGAKPMMPCYTCNGMLYVNGGTPEAIPCFTCKQFGEVNADDWSDHVADYIESQLREVAREMEIRVWNEAATLTKTHVAEENSVCAQCDISDALRAKAAALESEEK